MYRLFCSLPLRFSAGAVVISVIKRRKFICSCIYFPCCVGYSTSHTSQVLRPIGAAAPDATIGRPSLLLGYGLGRGATAMHFFRLELLYHHFHYYYYKSRAKTVRAGRVIASKMAATTTSMLHTHTRPRAHIAPLIISSTLSLSFFLLVKGGKKKKRKKQTRYPCRNITLQSNLNEHLRAHTLSSL